MFSPKVKTRLIDNWPDRESLQCMAEARVYDPRSDWQAYIYAMNPEEHDEIACVVFAGKASCEICIWRLNLLKAMYNADGDGVVVDEGFRRRRIANILRLRDEGKL